MKQQSPKYPTRADTLALLKARERAAASPAASPARSQELLLCYALPVLAPR